MMRRIAIPDKPRRPDACAPPVNYTYDNDSRLTQVTDPTGTYQFTFDNMGRLTGTSTQYAFLTSHTFTTSYGYDTASNRTTFTDPENGSSGRVARTRNGKQNLGAPLSFSRGWVLGFSFLLSFRNDINCNQPRLTLRVERPTAPRPVLRMAHQSARHRVAVHVVQLLSFLPVRVHVEVIKTRLPKAARSFRLFRKGQPHLFLGCVSPLPSHFLRHALLQHLQHRRRCAFLRFADQQMHVLRHHHITHQQKAILRADARQFAHKQIPRTRRLQ